jgi:hypothetical protein
MTTLRGFSRRFVQREGDTSATDANQHSQDAEKK